MHHPASIGFTTLDGIPVLPRLLRIGRETHQADGYHIVTAAKGHRHGVVQVTLDGTAACCERIGDSRGRSGWRPVPAGQAVLAVVGEADCCLGLRPGASDPVTHLFVGFAGEAALAMALDLVRRHGPVLPWPLDSPVLARCQELISPRAGHRDRTISAQEGARLVCDLLIELVAQAVPRTGRRPHLVEAAMAWFARHPGAGVAAAARDLGVSRGLLHRQFLARCGEAPSAWDLRRRLDRARELLAATALPVAEVARRCGWAGSSRFIASFRRIHGLSPGQWRQAKPG